MALKPTIYKAQVELADSDNNRYESLNLTLARHPSETMERMAARLLAYCLNAGRGLEFTKGLSTAEEPDLWQHADNGEIAHWIEVGQPEEPRLRKACGRARQVSVYAFGKSSDTWWKLNGAAIAALPRCRVWQLDWPDMVAIAGLLERTVTLTVSVVGGVMYLDNGGASASIEPRQLAGAEVTAE
ncbi:MAG: YaeQ family protein [Pseudomonadales bacterium]|nr:YaeQ family protein [Pseudomonadales bacterium]MCP5167018.1 YaeQ family protein [Pseudomonadales bacterium]